MKAHGVEHITIDGTHVAFTTTVGTANKILGTDFNWYKNERKEAHLRTTKYSVPANVKDHIEFIHPTLKFPGIHELRNTIHDVGDASVAQKALAQFAALAGDLTAPLTPLTDNAAAAVVCNNTITPTCLLNLYNVHYGAQNNSKLAYASFLNQYARYSDLSTFETASPPGPRARTSPSPSSTAAETTRPPPRTAPRPTSTTSTSSASATRSASPSSAQADAVL